ncbi:uncharacterized protein LOC117645707 [Thrips palmi]|uniref:Uncharacterized protein LOC117645707 n=1 Tax=Thrips palmi TaxID=161013 RepID=A0A6P8ZN89_THRPL|nr:uncharacterized protein LOC117645707 [Thrips palmi]
MDRVVVAVLASSLVVALAAAAPRIRVARDTGAALRLGLPSNATSIRAGEMLSERFSCAGRHYGYYADPDNDCQLFHVCLPVQFDDGRGAMYKWSFVCPEETIFNQETFTCSRREDAISCQDSERFYGLNEDLGVSRRQQQQQDQDLDDADNAADTMPDDNMADVVEDTASYQHPVQAVQHQQGMVRPMEGRPQALQQAQADGPQQQATTDTSDEGTNKYGAFTTIRY